MSTQQLQPASARVPIPSYGAFKILVLGMGGGGFDYAARGVLNDCKSKIDVVAVFGAPAYADFPWKSHQSVVAMYRLRSPALTGDTLINNILYFIYNLYYSLWILLAERPHVVFAVGTAQAIPFALVARCLRIRVWFAESFTRVSAPSRTGLWMYRFGACDRFFYYWPQLAAWYPKGIFAGGPT